MTKHYLLSREYEEIELIIEYTAKRGAISQVYEIPDDPNEIQIDDVYCENGNDITLTGHEYANILNFLYENHDWYRD